APVAADPPPWTARIPRNWVYGAHPMRRTTARSVLVLFALSLTACEPPAVSPTPVMVIARDANGQYRPQQVQVRSLTRPVTLEGTVARFLGAGRVVQDRSEEHTSELQSRENLVCRLLLEKKKIKVFES